MSARSFFDTNVLVYTDDHDAPVKQKRALDLLADARRAGSGVVSTQVLSEYFVTVTRKLGVDPVVARRKVELFGHLHLAIVDLDDVLAAADLQRLHHVSFWDALVLRAAQETGCSVLYSEDLQDGRRFDRTTVRNPFR